MSSARAAPATPPLPAPRVPPALAVVAVFVVIHLIAAIFVGLGFDEAYYWTWSRHLSASYYDHPPMVAWWIRAGTAILGDNPLGVRILFVLAMAPISAALYWTGALLFDRLTATFAVAFLNATLVFGVLGFVASPDAPSVLFWTLAILALALIYAHGDQRWWLGVGLAAGLGVLSKLTALFLGPTLLVAAAALQRLRVSFLRPWLWLGGLVALLVVLPMLLWNIDHGFMTWNKQFGRLGTPGFKPTSPFEFVGTVFLVLNPAVSILAGFAALLWRRRRPRDAGLGLLLVTVAPMLAFLLVAAFRQRIEANWPAPLYPTLALVGAVGAARVTEALRGRRFLAWYRDIAFPFGLGATIVATFLMINPGNLVPARYDLGRTFRAWGEFSGAVERARGLAGAAWIAPTSYDATAELAFHLRGSGVPVVGIAERQRYVFAPPPDPALLAKPALLVSKGSDATRLQRCFATVRPVAEISRSNAAGEYERFYAFKGEGAKPALFAEGC
ncbi:MAG: glycosyltransferase family 39 protein [Rhizobiales bacterium]|nr:glycosyltransferase family 39 protein [Hyphomicrobiales bacterium]